MDTTNRIRKHSHLMRLILLAVFVHPAFGANALAVTRGQAAGANLPYDEIEAESAETNGTIIDPDRIFTRLAAEASGRRAVTLTEPGQYVEFTLPRPANSVVVRYSIPDSPDGAGLAAPLSLYIDGARQPDLTLTSAYGWFYGGFPFTNTPVEGNPHHFYDEVHRLTGQMRAGTKVRLQVDPGNIAPSYTIDLADFEQVDSPAAMPAGFLSITDPPFGADPTGAKDASGAIQEAVNTASSQGKGLWIPPGTFTATRHIMVDKVTIRGAGPWYSVLHGDGVGIYGSDTPHPSTNVQLYDFGIFGEVRDRDDSAQVNGIGGALADSIIQNVWIEHTKVGIWLDGPFDNLAVTGVRIRNVTADGLNFHRGVSHSVVQQSMIRNTGDDGLAMWTDSQNDHDNVFQFNTVQLPILANGIAIYGGANNRITDNYVADTLVQGGGIHVGNRFNSVALSGTTLIARNTLVRTGSFDPNWRFGIGAIWFYSLDAAMTGAIIVEDNDIIDSSYEAIQFMGKSVRNVTFNNNRIQKAGTFAVQIQSQGSATFNGVTATGLGAGGIFSCQGSRFTVVQGPGNSGWNSGAVCGPWPAPIYAD
jgi:hypothetical protein